MSKVIGIDISKGSFDVAFLSEDKSVVLKKYANGTEGFKKFCAELTGQEHVVMEATGIYHLRLATVLYNRGIQVSVVNPLVIRRFSQTVLSRVKTDAKDAAIIAQYGYLHKPSLWNPRKPVMEKLRQQMSALRFLRRQESASRNFLHAWSLLPESDPAAGKALRMTLSAIQKQIGCIEKQMLATVKGSCQNEYDRLVQVPGIGPKTAMLLIAITDGFERFDNVKKLVSYIGLSPRIFESGSSVKGRSHITKLGMGEIRRMLYLCAWTAKRCNKACKELYDRLKAKGKPERVIKIAIAHKLLRIAFAISKNQKNFDENYHLKFGF
jgi:transposase